MLKKLIYVVNRRNQEKDHTQQSRCLIAGCKKADSDSNKSCNATDTEELHALTPILNYNTLIVSKSNV